METAQYASPATSADVNNRHTVAAILRADPSARVGGPAVAYWKSPILPALMAFCDREKAPLSFVSWHIYNSDPKAIQETIEGVKALLAQHPSLRPETILDEWNMALTVPPQDVRIQPAFVAESLAHESVRPDVFLLLSYPRLSS
ncbi:MAG: hypothetical protein ABSC47_05945 [Terracidiphilus sp.]